MSDTTVELTDRSRQTTDPDPWHTKQVTVVHLWLAFLIAVGPLVYTVFKMYYLSERIEPLSAKIDKLSEDNARLAGKVEALLTLLEGRKQ